MRHFLDRCKFHLAMYRNQEDLLDRTTAVIQQWQKYALDGQKQSLDLVLAWRISLETPEQDVRDDLDKLITDLSDAIARLEEQIVV